MVESQDVGKTMNLKISFLFVRLIVVPLSIFMISIIISVYCLFISKVSKMGFNISVGQKSSEILQFKEMKCEKKLKIVLIFITLYIQPFNFKL